MARLPVPGSDGGTWGDVLNSFLTVEHNTDGTLKKAGDIAQAKSDAAQALTTAQQAGTIADGSVTTAKLANNAVTNAKLDVPTQTTLGTVASKYTKPAGGITSADINMTNLAAAPQLTAAFGTYTALANLPVSHALPGAGVVAALNRGYHSVVLQAVGDSTTVGTNAWFAALGRRLGGAFPAYTVLHRSYSESADQWKMPTTLQSGTGNGGGTRGLRYAAGAPFSYSLATPITGDIDIRVNVALDNWATGSIQTLASQWNTGTAQRVWSFQVTATGYLAVNLSSDGATSLATVTSTSAPSVSNGSAAWLRATVDVDNGSSGRTITFYTSSDGDTWNQLGTAVTTSGAISLFNGNPIVALGSRYLVSTWSDRSVGNFYWIEVRNGINGPSMVPPLIDSWEFLQSDDDSGCTWLGAPVILMVNGGIGGMKISYFSDPARKDILHQDHGADMFMLNDSHNEGRVSNQSWISTLSTYITMVKGYLPNRPIVLVGQNPVANTYSFNAHVKRYTRVQAEATWAASQQGVYFADSILAFDNLAVQLSGDGLHPSTTAAITDGTAGYQVWGDILFCQLFKPYIGPFDNPFL